MPIEVRTPIPDEVDKTGRCVHGGYKETLEAAEQASNGRHGGDRSSGGHGVTDTAKVSEDRKHPGEWRVEWFNNNGGCEVEIFLGSNARDQ